MTPLMEILQNRISTVACKTLRVSHISHRPHHQLINEPDSTLKKLVPCPKNGEHLTLQPARSHHRRGDCPRPASPSFGFRALRSRTFRCRHMTFG